MKRPLLVALMWASALPILGVPRPATAAELQAYAGGVAGQADGNGCATSGPQIGSPWFAGLNVPLPGIAACNLSGGVDNRVGASGPLAASQTVSGAAVGGTFSGTAQANAAYWSLGVSASGSNTGGAAPGFYRQTAAFARFLLPVTLTSAQLATGTPGALNLSFLIEGSMFSLSNAPYSQQVQTSLGIRINAAPGPWTVFSANLYDAELPTLGGGATGLPGSFVRGPGSLSGSANVTSTGNFSFQWGVPFTVEVAFAATESTCCYGTSMGTDFLNTARLSGIQAFSPSGAVTDFSGTDGLGNLLGPTGIVGAVPEPPVALLLVAGLAVLPLRTVAARVGRRRRPHRPRSSLISVRAAGRADPWLPARQPWRQNRHSGTASRLLLCSHRRAMNKAFVKESDDSDDDDAGAPGVLPLPPGARNYITPAGYQHLRDELMALLDVERPKVVEAVSWAAKNGDRSENGDYIYGKKRLREIDRRIHFLTKRLDIAEVADPSAHHGNDQVFFGATVTYASADGDERTVTIKGIDESDSLHAEVSWISPIARALLKAREGDEVSLVTPAGVEKIEVVRVRYPAPMLSETDGD